MKKAILGIMVVAAMASCKKEGYVYKCSYTTPNGWVNSNNTIKSVATNFFIRDIKDSVGAVNWYKQTDAYRHAIEMGADSLWITYWGTAEEWKDAEKAGWNI